jgi:hypothetical protein
VKTLPEEIRDSGDARHIIEQPLFLKAKEEVYGKLRQARQQMLTRSDPQAAMDLVRLEQIADQFFDYFEGVLQTGKLAQQRLDEQRVQDEHKKRGLALFGMFGRGAL